MSLTAGGNAIERNPPRDRGAYLEDETMATMTTCGACKAYRESGDVCCSTAAYNQGWQHATCNHEAPPMPQEWLAEYERGSADAVAAMERGEEVEAFLVGHQRFQLVETNVYNDGRPSEERCREVVTGEEARLRGIYFDRVYQSYAVYSESHSWGILIGTISRLPE